MDKKFSEEKRNILSYITEFLGKERGEEGRRLAAAGAAAKKFALPAAAGILSFASSASSPALGALPIGPALLSAAPSFSTALPILVGALLSAMRLGKGAVPFILISLGVFFVRLSLGALGVLRTRAAKDPLSDSIPFIKLDSAFNTSRGVRVLTSFAASVLLGLSNVLSGTNIWYDVFGTALGATLSPLLCFAYSSVLDTSANPTLRKAGAGAILYAVVLSVSGASVGGINIAFVIAMFSSLAAGLSFGAADGALIGTLAGLGLDASSFAVFPIAGMCSGALGAYSAGGAAVASAALGMSWALFSKGIAAVSSTLPELVLGTALFYPAARLGIIPKDGALFEEKSISALPKSSARSVSDRMRSLADAMEHMSKVFSNLSRRLKFPANAEIAALCEKEFLAFCDVCPKRAICHAREHFESGGAVKRAAEALAAKGRLLPSDLPATMMRGCSSVDEIAAAVNSSYGRLIEDCVRGDATGAVARDFAGIARMIVESVSSSEEEHERNEALSDALSERLASEGITIESLSVYGKRRPEVCVRGFTVKDLTCGAKDLKKMAEEAIGAPLSEPEMSIEYDKLNMYCAGRKRYTAKYGVYSAEGREDVSGDVIRAFRGDEDDFYLLICDGMGSGREAALTAKTASLFLERMLGAGCRERAAIEMLNDFTRERRIECFSTVDLLKIDPYSGDAVFYKCGAAPSFVLRGGRLFRIECESSPVGIIERAVAKKVNFKLRAGDLVVMLSDGAIPDEERSAALYEMMSDRKNFDCPLPEAARAIAQESAKECRRTDDATVGIVRIETAA